MTDGDAAADRATVFAERGFLEPVRLFSQSQRTLLLSHLTHGKKAGPDTWSKGRAVNDRLCFDMATRPGLLAIVKSLLGEDIVLWGASTIQRGPGQSHSWHVDIESAAPERHFASVWIGLHNTADAGLTFVARSHAIAKTVQEAQHDKGFARGEADDGTVLSWARAFDPSAEVVRPEVGDGDALIFDGRIWHKSFNHRETGTRLALLLQYACADAPVFMPEPGSYEWPFRLITAERPPVIVVGGNGKAEANRLVRPPPARPTERRGQVVSEPRRALDDIDHLLAAVAVRPGELAGCGHRSVQGDVVTDDDAAFGALGLPRFWRLISSHLKNGILTSPPRPVVSDEIASGHLRSRRRPGEDRRRERAPRRPAAPPVTNLRYPAATFPGDDSRPACWVLHPRYRSLPRLGRACHGHPRAASSARLHHDRPAGTAWHG